ncbi:hypothetical protein LTR85_009583 [Meristemomyces frigidus]|nr:hypothetical protein LTR85_009583 [Meristemomyces frigidus]
MPTHHFKEDGHNYGAYQSDIYKMGLKGIRPSVSTDPRNWEAEAKKALSANAFGYVGNTHRDLSVELFGTKYPNPLLMAPVGVNKIFHNDGEEDCSVPYIMSTAASTSIEDMAAASDGHKWFQLYWPMRKDDDITISMLQRAQKAGVEVLVVTLDLWALSWRPSDLDNAYVPFFLGIGDQIGFSDPVFQKKYQQQSGKTIEDDVRAAAMNWEGVVFSGEAHKWEDLELLKANWKGPIVLKGIQTVEDAKLAVEHGMDGIIVDNHGGRQYDGAVGSLDMLPEIVDAVGDKLTVLFGSGIRTGADVMKAIALGAKACLVGRPIIYGLAADGEAGATHVLKCMLADLDMNLGLVGHNSCKDLNRNVLRRNEGFLPHAATSN